LASTWGRPRNYAALAVAEQTVLTGGGRPVVAYAFRHLQRWPLGTAYPQIVTDVREMLEKVPGADLVVDATATLHHTARNGGRLSYAPDSNCRLSSSVSKVA
jgi:hypothetical protein